jgi:hypothetical protein
MHPASPTGSLSSALCPSISTMSATNHGRRPQQHRLVSPSSPAFASYELVELDVPPARRRLPAYMSLPPPAYCPSASPVGPSPPPACQPTRSPSPGPSLRSSSPTSCIGFDRAREVAVRARLAPLLFPKPRGVRSVVKDVLGRSKRRQTTTTRMEDLDDFEREVAQRMVGEVRPCF